MLYLQDGKRVWLYNRPLEIILEKLNNLGFNLEKDIVVTTAFIRRDERVIKLTRYYEMLTNLKITTEFENNMIYIYVKGKIIDALSFIFFLENLVDVPVADNYISRDFRFLKYLELNGKIDVRISPETSLIIKFLREWNLDDGYYIIDALVSVKDAERIKIFLRKVFEKIYKCKPEDVLIDDNLTLDAISTPLLKQFRVS